MGTSVQSFHQTQYGPFLFDLNNLRQNLVNFNILGEFWFPSPIKDFINEEKSGHCSDSYVYRLDTSSIISQTATNKKPKMAYCLAH